MQIVKIAVLPVTIHKKPAYAKLPTVTEINQFFDTKNPMGLIQYIHKNTFSAYEILDYTIFNPIKVDALNIAEEAEMPGSAVFCDNIINEYSLAQGVNWNQFSIIMIIPNHLESKVAAGFFTNTLVPRFGWFPLWYKFGPPNSNLAYYKECSICPTERTSIPLPIQIRQHELLHNLGFNHIFDTKGNKIGNHVYCALGHGYALSAGNLYTNTFFQKGNLGFVQMMYNKDRFRDVHVYETDHFVTSNLLALEVAHYQPLVKPRSFYQPFLIIVKPKVASQKTYFIEYRRESIGYLDMHNYELQGKKITGFDKNLPFKHNLVIHSYNPKINQPDERYIFEASMDLPINIGGYLNQKESITLKGWHFGIILPAVVNKQDCLTVQVCGLTYYKANS